MLKGFHIVGKNVHNIEIVCQIFTILLAHVLGLYPKGVGQNNSETSVALLACVYYAIMSGL